MVDCTCATLIVFTADQGDEDFVTAGQDEDEDFVDALEGDTNPIEDPPNLPGGGGLFDHIFSGVTNLLERFRRFFRRRTRPAVFEDIDLPPDLDPYEGLDDETDDETDDDDDDFATPPDPGDPDDPDDDDFVTADQAVRVFTRLPQVENAWREGYVFTEQNFEEIRNLLGPNVVVRLFFRGLMDSVVIPLTGPFTQLNEFFTILRNRFTTTPVEVINVSDDPEEVIPIEIQEIAFFRLRRSARIRIVGIFEYDNLTDIDLSKYQIFTASNPNWHEREDPCLISSLRHSGVSEGELQYIKSNMPGYYVDKKILHKVARLINKKIVVHRSGERELRSGRNNLIRKYSYGDGHSTIELGSFYDHIFPLSPTIYSLYSIQHYFEVKHLPRFYDIVRRDSDGVYKREPHRRKLNSMELIVYMWLNNLFADSERYIQYSKFNHHSYLCQRAVDHEQRPFSRRRLYSPRNPLYLVTDFECDVSGENHSPILSGFCDQDLNCRQFKGSNCVSMMFDEIVRVARAQRRTDVSVGFHNLAYDFNVMVRHLYKVMSVCKKDNLLYGVTILHRRMKINLKDTYKIIPHKLLDFEKLFDLPEGKKEAMPYTFYNHDNIMSTRLSDLGEFRNALETEDLKHKFDDIVAEEVCLGCPNFHVDSISIDHVAYYMYYHKWDMITLMRGMQSYEARLTDFTSRQLDSQMDIKNFYTSSSFTDCYFQRKGCYDGVFELKGNLRSFVQEAVRGGICYANPNFVKRVITSGVADLDAVSEYPSAMKRIANECGYPCGPCKLIQIFSYPLPYLYYIVRIRITNNGKYQQIPFVSVKVNGKILRFNRGDFPEQEFVVDKITLEDWIEFCDITFEILEGVYWDGDVNCEVGETILSLHDLRRYYKSIGSDLQACTKLLMNEAYGKLVIKKVDRNVVIKGFDEAIRYASDRFGLLKRIVTFGDHTEVTLAHYDDSYNRNHLGVMVLTMSKRILHEVLNICSENNYNVYYVDTDSMHIDKNCIEPLRTKYRLKYNRELIGKNLGQFHSDFDIKCPHTEQVYSTKTILLGKKVYCDELLCPECLKESVHFRVKGVPSYAVITQAEAMHCTIFELYCEMTKQIITFILNPAGHVKIAVKITGVITLPVNTFKRQLFF